MKLSERLLAGDGPDRELDAEILEAFGWNLEKNWLWGRWWVRGKQAFPAHSGKFPPPYTASLESALSLYPVKPDTMPTNPRKAAAEALEQRGL